jgi:hypothetical protein
MAVLTLENFKIYEQFFSVVLFLALLEKKEYYRFTPPIKKCHGRVQTFHIKMLLVCEY